MATPREAYGSTSGDLQKDFGEILLRVPNAHLLPQKREM